MTSGGPRTPRSPAPVSGPGSLSKRTDGGPASKQAARWIAGGDYGDGGLMAEQQGAPMAQAPGAAPASSMSGPQITSGPEVIPLGAPTQFPNQPVTSGANAGAGPGMASLGLSPQGGGGTSAKQLIDSLAAHPDASPELKQLAAALGG